MGHFSSKKWVKIRQKQQSGIKEFIYLNSKAFKWIFMSFLNHNEIVSTLYDRLCHIVYRSNLKV